MPHFIPIYSILFIPKFINISFSCYLAHDSHYFGGRLNRNENFFTKYCSGAKKEHCRAVPLSDIIRAYLYGLLSDTSSISPVLLADIS